MHGSLRLPCHPALGCRASAAVTYPRPALIGCLLGPSTTLAPLLHRGCYADAALLAALPRLAQLTAWNCGSAWRAEVKRLMPAVAFNCRPETSCDESGGSSQDADSGSSSFDGSTDEEDSDGDGDGPAPMFAHANYYGGGWDSASEDSMDEEESEESESDWD